jgi:hypothetical protein
MDSSEEPPPAARPYFVAADVDFETLPESVKVAFQTIGLCRASSCCT